MYQVDFHTHTIFSDGTLRPDELHSIMKDRGVKAFSITDHDALGANRELRGKTGEIDYVTGIELTTHYRQKTLHLLAYGFDPESHELADFLMRQRLARRKRAEEIVGLLNIDLEKEKKKTVSLADILALEVEGPITRPDIAKYLIANKYVRDFREAFDRWLRKYNVPLDTADIYETIGLVHGIGGFPVLAHAFAPYVSIQTVTTNISEQVELLADLKRNGLGGIELFGADYHEYADELPLRLAVAERIGFLVTGGSDFHGGGKTSTNLPGIEVPEAYVEKFLEHVS